VGVSTPVSQSRPEILDLRTVLFKVEIERQREDRQMIQVCPLFINDSDLYTKGTVASEGYGGLIWR
jgi:hypothetical protein